MFGIMEAMLSFLRRQVGLRTDTADANGSLHAKVRSVKNDTANIGTPSDTRANNTLFGKVSSLVKSVQRGTLTVRYDFSNSTVTISSVDPSKALLIFSFTSGTGNPQSPGGALSETFFRGQITSPTQISFSRRIAILSAGNDAHIDWQVIEFY